MSDTEEEDLAGITSVLEEIQRRAYKGSRNHLYQSLDAAMTAEIVDGMRRSVEDQHAGDAGWDKLLGKAFASAPAQWAEAAEQAISRFEVPQNFAIIAGLVARIEAALSVLGMKAPHPIRFGTSPNGMINGTALSVEGNRCRLVMLDAGLFVFANLISKALAACFPAADDGPHPAPDAILAHLDAHPEADRRFGELIMAYVVRGDPHFAPPYLPSHAIARVAGPMREGIELFVLAHEYGHCIAGHLDPDRPTKRSMLDTGQVVVGEVTTEWQDEHEADRLGAYIAIQALLSRGHGFAVATLGICVFFAAAHILDCAIEILTSGRIDVSAERSRDCTHPPPLLRRAKLMAALAREQPAQGEEFTRAARLSGAVDHALALLFERLAPTLKRLHDDGLRPAGQWDRGEP